MGVNHATVERAEKFVEGVDAAEEVSAGITKDIQAGKVKATLDEMITIANTPPEKRKELVDCLYVPTSEMTKEEREQERQRRKELFRSIDNLYASHLNTNRPPATGADMLKAFCLKFGRERQIHFALRSLRQLRSLSVLMRMFATEKSLLVH